jgi:hypothetical protein
MPVRVADQTQVVFDTEDLRWARQHSGAFDWELPPPAIAGSATAGPRAGRLAIAPARLAVVAVRKDHNLRTIK